MKAPLSFAEAYALRTYNEKPIMTLPQHRFYTGPGYLEVRTWDEWRYLHTVFSHCFQSNTYAGRDVGM